ncbi:hypothetical protein EDD90_2839 [Streptomyces sp. Ag109_O5-1]|uniref:hypothetical protein n=1 Tax=Streptomyces sp. Ag109_O5-1 TaxID=1938851 RepID=UPI000F514815|nr:hypothetical protein [Streptomyces sp. Ag109_O5-1]RPE39821.1 hypothetical protein EDD90_2839 [Streptomyces sp. Ag109_O5-1]
MTNPQRAPRRSALAYQIAADAHWSTAGTTHQGGALALPERRATRANAGTPYNLSVYDLVLDHEHALEDFARRYGREVEIPVGRTALADYAATLAENDDAARIDYDQLRLVHDLRAALTIGDADDLLGKLECPACLCWSLVGTRSPQGAWVAACRVLRCAITPGEPHVFTLWQVARHNVKAGVAAAA